MMFQQLWLPFLTYIFLLVTLAQFCESKAIKKNSLYYKVYVFVQFPLILLFKLFGKDFRAELQTITNNLTNGKTYIVSIFYYLLYGFSFYFMISDLIQQKYLLLPYRTQNNQVTFQKQSINYYVIQNISQRFLVQLIMTHIMSLISFIVAIKRDPNPKFKQNQNGEQYDYFLYEKREITDAKKTFTVQPRQNECENCKIYVTKQDHHCVWINQCVGKRNLLWFVVFLLTTTISCIQLTVQGIVTMLKILSQFPSSEHSYMYLYKTSIITTKQMALILIVSVPKLICIIILHGLIGIMLVPFCIHHIKQLATNITSVEIAQIKWIIKNVRKRKCVLYVATDLINHQIIKKYEEFKEKINILQENDNEKYQKEINQPLNNIIKGITISNKSLREFALKHKTSGLIMCNLTDPEKPISTEIQHEKLKYLYVDTRNTINILKNYRFYDKGLVANIYQVLIDGFV